MNYDPHGDKIPVNANSPEVPIAVARGIGGALVGALIGFFAFKLFWDNGFYSAMLPGALLGLGFGLASGRRMLLAGVACGIAALAFGLWTEWKVAPFIGDDGNPVGFINFLREIITSGRPVKLLMHGLGAAAGFWFGQGR